ncbi:hypothetical protein PUN28_008174 [Cardiocondyla obscurior]
MFYKEDEDGNLLDDISESKELDKEIISIVRANRFLYNKNEKLYSNTQMKRLAWTTIGENLSKKKTGVEVEHRFAQLRQRFVKERKKVIQSQGRSGAGASHQIYTPQWDLYNDLMFLADTIKHRNTSSNYKRRLSIPEADVLCSDTNNKRSCPSTSSSSSLLTPYVCNESLILSDCDVNEYSNIMETFNLSQPESPKLLSQPENSLSYLKDKDSRKTMSSAKQVQKTTSNTFQKCVPEPDSFAKCKKQNVDFFNKTLLDQSKSLNVLAHKVGDALLAMSQPVPVTSQVTESVSLFSSDIKAMLSSIGFALQKVPEYNQLDYLIAIMQLVKNHIT